MLVVFMIMECDSGTDRGSVYAIRSLIARDGSRLYAGARQAVDALVSSLQRHAAGQIKDFDEIRPEQRRLFGYRCWSA